MFQLIKQEVEFMVSHFAIPSKQYLGGVQSLHLYLDWPVDLQRHSRKGYPNSTEKRTLYGENR